MMRSSMQKRAHSARGCVQTGRQCGPAGFCRGGNVCVKCNVCIRNWGFHFKKGVNVDNSRKRSKYFERRILFYEKKIQNTYSGWHEKIRDIEKIILWKLNAGTYNWINLTWINLIRDHSEFMWPVNSSHSEKMTRYTCHSLMRQSVASLTDRPVRVCTSMRVWNNTSKRWVEVNNTSLFAISITRELWTPIFRTDWSPGHPEELSTARFSLEELSYHSISTRNVPPRLFISYLFDIVDYVSRKNASMISGFPQWGKKGEKIPEGEEGNNSL